MTNYPIYIENLTETSKKSLNYEVPKNELKFIEDEDNWIERG